MPYRASGKVDPAGLEHGVLLGAVKV
jgi:hypothetical protein